MNSSASLHFGVRHSLGESLLYPIAASIFSYIRKPSDLLNCRLVCKAWNHFLRIAVIDQIGSFPVLISSLQALRDSRKKEPRFTIKKSDTYFVVFNKNFMNVDAFVLSKAAILEGSKLIIPLNVWSENVPRIFFKDIDDEHFHSMHHTQVLEGATAQDVKCLSVITSTSLANPIRSDMFFLTEGAEGPSLYFLYRKVKKLSPKEGAPSHLASFPGKCTFSSRESTLIWRKWTFSNSYHFTQIDNFSFSSDIIHLQAFPEVDILLVQTDRLHLFLINEQVDKLVCKEVLNYETIIDASLFKIINLSNKKELQITNFNFCDNTLFFTIHHKKEKAGNSAAILCSFNLINRMTGCHVVMNQETVQLRTQDKQIYWLTKKENGHVVLRVMQHFNGEFFSKIFEIKEKLGNFFVFKNYVIGLHKNEIVKYRIEQAQESKSSFTLMAIRSSLTSFFSKNNNNNN